jgi:hypothetical protein
MISHWLKAPLLVSLSLVIAFAQGPPVETGPFRQPDLVELIKLDPTIRLDIRYATKNNFLGKAVYKRVSSRWRGRTEPSAVAPDATVNFGDKPTQYGLILKETLVSGATALGSVLILTLRFIARCALLIKLSRHRYYFLDITFARDLHSRLIQTFNFSKNP